MSDYGRFNVFWKPFEKKGLKICEGGAMAYELRKTLPKDSSELQMKFESKPIAKTMEIEELELSLMNLYVSFFLISVSNLPRSGVLV